MSSSTIRPPTSKPRGVCRYYTHSRGCFSADKCKFLHGEPPIEVKPGDPPMLTPYDKAKRCRFYAQGFCKRGDACWFLHVSDRKTLSQDDDEELCSICFEKPVTFGLLGGCSHVFCITCINQWRDPKNKPGGVLESGNTKKCPMCRASTKFITPSSKFWKAGTKEKDDIIKAYKDSMSRIACCYFQTSLETNKDKPFCPYGKDCFYQHINADGTPYIFKEGVDVAMRKFQRHRRPVIDSFNTIPFSIDFAEFLLPTTRFTIRERPIIASQSNTSDTHPTQPRRRRRDRERHRVNGLTDTARRLQQVGESLERLNDVISEGATLDSLNTAVEALRAGLGRFDVSYEDGGRRMTRQRADDADGIPEDEVMERLEVLADQMLASIHVLRMNTQEEETDETSLSALGPVERDGGPMPSTPLRPHSWTDSANDGYESPDSMPGLQSVSNPSDSGTDDSSDSNEDEGPHRAMRLGDRAVLTATHTVELIQSIEQFSGSQGRPYFRRVVERPEESVAVTVMDEGDQDADSDSDIPVLETPRSLELSGEPEIEPRSEPPFVTDGRGRVVWTSPAEEDKSGQPTEEESGGEPASRPEAATGSGRLLGWFNALF